MERETIGRDSCQQKIYSLHRWINDLSSVDGITIPYRTHGLSRILFSVAADADSMIYAPSQGREKIYKGLNMYLSQHLYTHTHINPNIDIDISQLNN